VGFVPRTSVPEELNSCKVECQFCPGEPSAAPTPTPTSTLTASPTYYPTFNPTPIPPTPKPTATPTFFPTFNPTPSPTKAPSFSPTFNPTFHPPTPSPPTSVPSISPTATPSAAPGRYYIDLGDCVDAICTFNDSIQDSNGYGDELGSSSPEAIYYFEATFDREVVFSTCSASTNFRLEMRLYFRASSDEGWKGGRRISAMNNPNCGYQYGYIAPRNLEPNMQYALVVEGRGSRKRGQFRLHIDSSCPQHETCYEF